MFTNGMLETHTKTVDLEDDNADAMLSLVRWAHGNQNQELFKKRNLKDVLILADKYDFFGMLEHVQNKVYNITRSGPIILFPEIQLFAAARFKNRTAWLESIKFLA